MSGYLYSIDRVAPGVVWREMHMRIYALLPYFFLSEKIKLRSTIERSFSQVGWGGRPMLLSQREDKKTEVDA